jgi:hypothetical protein
VFETSAAIRQDGQPLVVEFLVIVCIINNARAVKIFGLPGRGASSTCQVSRIPRGSHPREIALDLSLYRPLLETPLGCDLFVWDLELK